MWAFVHVSLSVKCLLSNRAENRPIRADAGDRGGGDLTEVEDSIHNDGLTYKYVNR